MKKIGMGVCLVVIQLLLVFPSLGGVISQWNFNGLSGRTFFDSVGDADLMFCYDNLAESFHEPKYVSRVLPSQAGAEGRGYGSCVYLCNFKPEHGVYPEHAVINIKRPDVLNFGRDSFTVTGWLKKDPVAGGYETILSGCGDRGGVSILIGRADRSWAGKLLFEVKGSDSVSIRSDNRVDDSCWHWFAAVSDQGSMRLFVDGVLQTAAGHYKPNTTVDLSGQAEALIGDGYTGYLDDISISREAFSEEVLRDIYENGLASIGGSSPDTVVEAVEESRLCKNRIKVSEKIIFDGWKGESVGGLVYRLAGVAVISEMPNSDLVAWCLTGQDNEPADDNCVITTRSSDRGKSWSEPEITLNSKDRKMIHQTAMVSLSDGRVVSLWACLPWKSRYTEWNYHRMYSEDCGRTWGTSEEFKVGDGNAAIAAPLQLANGEYFFPATVMEL